jgi:16S rRNA (cytidine1402-2'-O)-methyltransferase
MTSGRLFLVPNTLDFGVSSEADLQEVLPLGVIRVAAQLSHWVAENAKTTRMFLKRVDAVVPLHKPLQDIDITELPRPPKGARTATPIDLKPLLAPALQGQDLGLISEAGLPAVADPGAALVAAAHGIGVPVVALPGPSSMLLALAASGLHGQSYAFVGYLPVDAAARDQRIRELEALSKRAQQTQQMIETPYRNAALLTALIANLRGDTRLSVSCGLTTQGAWTRSAPVAQWKTSPTQMPNDLPAVFSLLAA